MSRAHSAKLFLKPVSPPLGDINITPLVDVVLVLLIIFMVVTPLLEKEITVQVPNSENVVNTSDIPVDQLVVRVDASGHLSINSEDVTDEAYIENLREKLKGRNAKDQIVFVVADDGANYGKVVSALDGAKKAGALMLGMATDEPSPHH